MMNKPNQTQNKVQDKSKPSPLVNAFLIGFLIGIIVFSVVVNSWGVLTLIPLFLIYKLTQKTKSPKNDSETPTLGQK